MIATAFVQNDCFYRKDYLYIKRDKEATRYKTYTVEVKHREFAFNMTFGVEIDSTF